MPINDIEEKHLNIMNRASQDVSLGTIIRNLEPLGSASAISITGGSMTNVSVSGSLTISGSTNTVLLNVTQNGSGSSARFGDGTNYATFEKDGSLIFSGSATYWNDLWVPLTTAKQGQTDKPAFDTTHIGYLFPEGDTTAIMYMIIQMPHGYKEGSTIHPHVHWMQTASGSPVFQMDYRWTNLGDTISASATYIMSTPELPYTSGSVHQLSSNPAGISGVGKKISSIMQVKLYRNDSSYTGNVLTYQFDIHYESDTLGSRTLLSE